MKLEETTVQDLLIILLGCAIYGVSMVLLAGIPTIPGNLMGIAAVCNTLFGWSTGTVNLLLSIPTIALGTMILGKRMLAYTAVTMVGMSVMTDLFTALVPNVPSGSILLYTILAGCIMGMGCGLILYVGGTTGGTTILGRLLVRKTPRISLGLWLTVMDVCIMIGGAAALHNIRSLLYSVIFEIVCCKAIDVTLVLLGKVLPPRW